MHTDAWWIWFQWPVLVYSALLERVAPPLCQLQPDPGPCSFSRHVWYFDHRYNKCATFLYGGCRGNLNRFESSTDCAKTCLGIERENDAESNQFSRSERVQSNVRKASWDWICLMEPDTRSCNASAIGQHGYYYNSSSGSCQQFLYSGCGQNNNRFKTQFDCRMACGHLRAKWKVAACDYCDSITSLCSREMDQSLWCQCQSGFHRNTDGRCIDDDECENGQGKPSKCDRNAWCINTPGSFICTCMAGYVGDGLQCVSSTILQLPSVSTHSTNLPYGLSQATTVYPLVTYQPWLPPAITPVHYNCQRCHKNATCWYGTCKCKTGFTGDGYSCQDIDECDSGEHQCAPYSTCYNMDGSYFCKCASGYAGTGFTCVRDKSVCMEPADVHYREQCGEAYFQRRYYFDRRYRQCRMFWYDNCKGTSRNIFPDLDTCRSFCEVDNGHRAVTVATVHHPSAVVTVPPHSQCHKPCQPGTCTGAYFMFYFNSTSRACSPFIYTGCGGNENRFLTKSSCEEACLISANTPELDCLQPVDYGYGRYDKKCQPRAGYVWYYDQDSEQCGRFWYQGCGGNTNRYTSQTECKAKCIGRSQKLRQHPKMMPFRNVRDCFQEKKEGFCYYVPNKPRTRYYYDYTDRQCKKFMYNGCGGNTNRFGSKEFCESTCQKVFKPKFKQCSYWPDIGPCNDMQKMWYFDMKTGVCRTFLWSGCGGNLNRFRRLEDCESVCVVKKEDLCVQPKQSGPCSQSYHRFYFDPALAICRPFTFGGCEGNDNNFHSIDECRARCERFQSTLKTLTAEAPSNSQKWKKSRNKIRKGIRHKYGKRKSMH